MGVRVSTYLPPVNADWNELDSASAAYIENKPTDLATQADLAGVSGMDADTLAQLETALAAWPMPRTNRPIVSGDYALLETDLGAVMVTQNATCSFPVYSANQLGKEYGIKNGSGGLITIEAATDEYFLIKGQQISSITVPSDEARQITRDTTQHNLIIV